MANAGYDAVVDIDDEVCLATNQLLSYSGELLYMYGMALMLACLLAYWHRIAQSASLLAIYILYQPGVHNTNTTHHPRAT